ncbi:MAG: hypothetical protein EOP84_02515 [Verrucomicrobiaceae bacterium]|nr:MAG: hypothetical protein EOP84_02515 [Verrucomicrobiaceae bacterium]
MKHHSFASPLHRNLRRLITLAVVLLCVHLLSKPTAVAATETARGLVLYAEPPSTYVEAFEYSSLTRQSVRYTTLVRSTGQRAEIHTGGILATVPYPSGDADSAAKASEQLNQIQTLSRKYPQFRSKLDAAASKWKAAAAAAKAPPVKPAPISASPKVPLGMVIVTTDGTRYEDVSVTKAEADAISFTHSAGVATVDFLQLSPELQRKYNYDPKRAEVARLAKKEAAEKARVPAQGHAKADENTPDAAPALESRLTWPVLIPSDYHPDATRIYSAQENEEALIEAQKFIVGTWTYTGQKQQILGQTIWIKWVINPDGTMLSYSAPAASDNWGEPRAGKWEVTTDKFTNTGVRYYAFNIKGHVTFAIITRNGAVEYRLPDWTLEMERGDTFPFSR